MRINMAWTAPDKSEKGTPGLIFRERLEYAVGIRNLAGDWKLLWSIHSHQASVNPDDPNGQKPDICKFKVSELLQQNDEDLMKYAEISQVSDDSLITNETRIEYVKVLAQCLKRIDEINKRGDLLENVKASQGAPMP